MRLERLNASPAQLASTATRRGGRTCKASQPAAFRLSVAGRLACLTLTSCPPVSPLLKRLHSAGPLPANACRPAPPAPTLVAGPPAASSAAPGFTPPQAAACAAPGERGAWSAVAVMRCPYRPCMIARMWPCFVQTPITPAHPESSLLLPGLLQQSGHICFWLPNRQLRCMPQGFPVPHHSHQVSSTWC